MHLQLKQGEYRMYYSPLKFGHAESVDRVTFIRKGGRVEIVPKNWFWASE